MEHFQAFTHDPTTGTHLPSATVTVYQAGTLTLAAIYSDDGVTPKSNPATSHATTGYINFYAANGRYDVTVSKLGYSTYTLSDVLLHDPTD